MSIKAKELIKAFELVNVFVHAEMPPALADLASQAARYAEADDERRRAQTMMKWISERLTSRGTRSQELMELLFPEGTRWEIDSGIGCVSGYGWDGGPTVWFKIEEASGGGSTARHIYLLLLMARPVPQLSGT